MCIYTSKLEHLGENLFFQRTHTLAATSKFSNYHHYLEALNADNPLFLSCFTINISQWGFNELVLSLVVNFQISLQTVSFVSVHYPHGWCTFRATPTLVSEKDMCEHDELHGATKDVFVLHLIASCSIQKIRVKETYLLCAY
jgi:hypothetical protein